MARTSKGKLGRSWSNQDLREFFTSTAQNNRPGLEEKTKIARQGKEPTAGKEKINTTPDIGGR